MGIGNKTLPALHDAARRAVPREAGKAPVVDLAGTAAAARAAADRTRKKASGANKATPAAPLALNLNPTPGSWRTY